MGKVLIATSAFQGFKYLLSTVVPESVFRLFGITFFPKEAANFYTNIVSETIKHREENTIFRPDFIQLLVQARKNELRTDNVDDDFKSAGFTTVDEHIESSTEYGQYTDLDIAAVALSFYFGGMETTTTAVCFAVYEIVLNASVRQKLQVEIDYVRDQLEGRPLTYEILQNMKYLDMVMSEALRRWPPVGVTNRLCVKPYTFEDNDGTTVEIDEGQVVHIPVQSFHGDSNLFADPLRFDPERFSDENKHSINQDAFLPFGSGPRNCVGSRLALMQAKCLLYYLFSHFSVEFSDKTQLPIKLKTMSLSYEAQSGLWFHLAPRMSSS